MKWIPRIVHAMPALLAAFDVIRLIMDKYAMRPMDASRAFLTSQTHAMLEDPELAMWEFSDRAIFDIWEAERVTGDPRNSAYLRSEI